jgi:hypothetical protein
MEVVCTPKLAFGPNMPRCDTLSTHTTQVCCVQELETRRGVAPSWLRHSCPTSQSARCNVPLLHVYVHVYSLVWACLCLKFYWMFYLEIKGTLVILWSIFIPLKINNAMNNIYQLVLISCATLSLSSWLLTPPTTILKSKKFQFPKRVWSQGFRIRDCIPVPQLKYVSCIQQDVKMQIYPFPPKVLFNGWNSQLVLTACKWIYIWVTSETWWYWELNFIVCITLKNKTEHIGQVVNNPALYSGVHTLKSHTGDQLSWLKLFMVFLSNFQQTAR